MVLSITYKRSDGGGMVSDSQVELGSTRLNSCRVYYIHFHVNTFGERINFPLLHLAMS